MRRAGTALLALWPLLIVHAWRTPTLLADWRTARARAPGSKMSWAGTDPILAGRPDWVRPSQDEGTKSWAYQPKWVRPAQGEDTNGRPVSLLDKDGDGQSECSRF